MIQVGIPGNNDERKMQDTQTCTRYCGSSLRLRLSRKQRLPRGEEKEKKNTLKTFKKKFQRKLSSKTSFTSEKKILSTFTFQTRSTEEKTSQRE